MYWVIAGTMMARQRILDIVEDQRDDQTPCTSFILDRRSCCWWDGRPGLSRWRYLDPDSAPLDMPSFGRSWGWTACRRRCVTNCGRCVCCDV